MNEKFAAWWFQQECNCIDCEAYRRGILKGSDVSTPMHELHARQAHKRAKVRIETNATH